MSVKQIIEDTYLKLVNDDSSLYNLEVLSKDNSDYRLVEKSFTNTCSELAKTRYSNKELKIERICRIHKKVPEVKSESKSKKNVLVFHGTPRENVEGILNYGFRSTERLFSIKFLLFQDLFFFNSKI